MIFTKHQHVELSRRSPNPGVSNTWTHPNIKTSNWYLNWFWVCWWWQIWWWIMVMMVCKMTQLRCVKMMVVIMCMMMKMLTKLMRMRMMMKTVNANFTPPSSNRIEWASTWWLVIIITILLIRSYEILVINIEISFTPMHFHYNDKIYVWQTLYCFWQ